MKKINFIDLFAGCGGLSEGFLKTGHYNGLAHVEWEKPMVDTLRNRLHQNWNHTERESVQRVIRFDIQKTDELFSGNWSDETKAIYQKDNDKEIVEHGMDSVIGDSDVDVIIGGPPCQAYSIAGRVRDEHGMKNDYRNYLFESYLKVVEKYKPKLFVFENVPGILSAQPGDRPIIEIIQESFNNAGYYVLSDLRKAIIDFTDYGVPQNRKRIIIVGLRKEYFGKERCVEMAEKFYSVYLPKYKVERKKTVKEAIGDLPKLYPLGHDEKFNGKRISHSLPQPEVPNHVARWQSDRDIDIFRLLTEDIETGRNQYTSIEALKALYTEKTGKTSNVHKYHVIRWDEPSNLIPAHLYKDGLRHIHPDSKQCRTLTVREAARLQTFDDDYIFDGSNVETYKMIGNAVPPLFAKELANAVADLLKDYGK